MKRRVFITSCASLLGAAALLKAQEGIRKSVIIRSKCVGCGDCVRTCPVKAIKLERGKALIDQNRCVGCRLCVSTCSYGAPR